MTHNKKNDINRRRFLTLLGTGAAVSGATLYGCTPGNQKNSSGSNKYTREAPTDKMTYRTTPNTGDKVSLLGYGCMRWPLRRNAEGEEEVDQEAVNELVDYAIAHGVNYFDTAPPYVRGWSEEATGIALSRHPRESYFIATKMSNHRLAGQGLSPAELFKASVDMYHRSFEYLRTGYIDYYLLHTIGGGDGLPFYKERFEENGLLDYLLEERTAGRIRNLGFSFHGDVKVYDYLLQSDIQWDFVQIQMNYIDWQHASGRNVNAEYLLGELAKRNIPAVIMEPLLGGRLTRIPAPAMTLLKQLRADDSPAAWALRYAATPDNVLTVLSGMVYMEHVKENIITYSPLEPINGIERETLEEKVTGIMLGADYIQCTTCEYCMPCPYGLDIPGIFAHYNRCISAGRMLKSSNDENYKKARREYLIGYNRSVPAIRQADHCIGCNICTNHCPQNIDIPAEMIRVNTYTEQLKQQLDF